MGISRSRTLLHTSDKHRKERSWRYYYVTTLWWVALLKVQDEISILFGSTFVTIIELWWSTGTAKVFWQIQIAEYNPVFGLQCYVRYNMIY